MSAVNSQVVKVRTELLNRYINKLALDVLGLVDERMRGPNMAHHWTASPEFGRRMNIPVIVFKVYCVVSSVKTLNDVLNLKCACVVFIVGLMMISIDWGSCFYQLLSLQLV